MRAALLPGPTMPLRERWSVGAVERTDSSPPAPSASCPLSPERAEPVVVCRCHCSNALSLDRSNASAAWLPAAAACCFFLLRCFLPCLFQGKSRRCSSGDRLSRTTWKNVPPGVRRRDSSLVSSPPCASTSCAWARNALARSGPMWRTTRLSCHWTCGVRSPSASARVATVCFSSSGDVPSLKRRFLSHVRAWYRAGRHTRPSDRRTAPVGGVAQRGRASMTRCQFAGTNSVAAVVWATVGKVARA